MKNLIHGVLHAFGNGVGIDHGGDNYEDVACNGVRVPAKPSGGGSGGRFDVHLNADMTVDKTFDEIKTAYGAGMVVCLVDFRGSISHMAYLPDDNYGVAFASAMAMNDGNVFYLNYYVMVDGTVNVSEVKVSGTVV
jgi:hypothetical protein